MNTILSAEIVPITDNKNKVVYTVESGNNTKLTYPENNSTNLSNILTGACNSSNCGVFSNDYMLDRLDSWFEKKYYFEPEDDDIEYRNTVTFRTNVRFSYCNALSLDFKTEKDVAKILGAVCFRVLTVREAFSRLERKMHQELTPPPVVADVLRIEFPFEI
jgi:hypothetical protein